MPNNKLILAYCIIVWVISIILLLLTIKVTDSFFIGLLVMVAVQFYSNLYKAIEYLRKKLGNH